MARFVFPRDGADERGAETLRDAHIAIIDRSLATLRAWGFEPPESAPGRDGTAHLCEVADAALVCFQAEGAPLEAELAAECLQVIAVYYSLLPEALDPADDGAAISRGSCPWTWCRS